jgi:predicted transcriptional regulator
MTTISPDLARELLARIDPPKQPNEFTAPEYAELTGLTVDTARNHLNSDCKAGTMKKRNAKYKQVYYSPIKTLPDGA